MPIGLVFNTSKAGTNGSGTHTTGLDSTGSSLIVMVTGGFGSITNPTDSKGNTWTKLTQQSTSGDDPDAAIYYCANPTVGTNHTFDDTASYQPICVAGFSGISLVSPFDQQNGAVGTVLTSKQPGSVTPQQGGELIISALMWNGNGVTNVAVDSSLAITNTVSYSTGATYGASLAWYATAAASAYNPTWSWSTNTAKVAAMIATFKAVPSVGSTLLLMGVG
jgi:hypothetical protein